MGNWLICLTSNPEPAWAVLLPDGIFEGWAMRRLPYIVAFILGALWLVLSPSREGHRAPCHQRHSCPSDHGTYVCGGVGTATNALITDSAATESLDRLPNRGAGRTTNASVRGSHSLHRSS